MAKKPKRHPPNSKVPPTTPTPRHPAVGIQFSSKSGQPLSVSGQTPAGEFQIISSSPIGPWGKLDQYELLDLLVNSTIWTHGNSATASDLAMSTAIEQLEAIRNNLQYGNIVCCLAIATPIENLKRVYLRRRYFST